MTTIIMTTIIGIDPGRAGGIAWTLRGGILAEPMPATEADVVALLREILNAAIVEETDIEAHIEKVSGFAGKAQPGSAMFKFGFGCGVIEGALRALNIRTIYVRPQEWQRYFSLGTAKSAGSKTAWKNKLKSEAQRRFPEIKVTLAIADALLILDYARSTWCARLKGS